MRHLSLTRVLLQSAGLTSPALHVGFGRHLPSIAVKTVYASHGSRMLSSFSDVEGPKPHEPSERQVKYAELLATRLDKPLPDAARIDLVQCSNFIEDAMNRVPPSDSQLSLAKKLAVDHNKLLPDGIESNLKACQRFISRTLAQASTSPARARPVTMTFDDGLGYGGGGEPSEKQMSYAQSLAQRTGLRLPPEALSDREACSAFIDEALSVSPPTSRQLAFAETLAAASGSPLTAEVRDLTEPNEP